VEATSSFEPLKLCSLSITSVQNASVCVLIRRFPEQVLFSGRIICLKNLYMFNKLYMFNNFCIEYCIEYCVW